MIPTSLAPRYRTPPAGYSSSSATYHTDLAVVVAVNSHQPICQIECRSHLVSVDMGSAGAPPDLLDFDVFYAQASSGREGGSAALNPRQATVRLSDPNAGMHKDFVVFIRTSRDDDSVTRSQALLSPANEHGHSALMVTIQPSELFSTHKPQIDFRGEIVFIADRSGVKRFLAFEMLSMCLSRAFQTPAPLTSTPSGPRFSLYGSLPCHTVRRLWTRPFLISRDSRPTWVGLNCFPR